MSKLTIFHFVDSMDPVHGGPPSVVASLASAQAARGHVVTVACKTHKHLGAASGGSFRHFPGSDGVRWCNYDYGYIRAIFAPQPILPQIGTANQHCIVHVHGMWRPELLQVIRECRSAGIACLLSSHGMLSPWSLSQKSMKKRLALKLAWTGALKNASAIHALNADEADSVSRMGVSVPIEVLPNGIFLEELSTGLTEIPGMSPSRRYILFLGRLHYGKGLDLLAKAFSLIAGRFDDLDLVVVGPDEGARKGFEQLIRDLELVSRVHILGPVYGARKHAIVSQAVCLCHPSYQEGCSMSILEVMGAGTPVVISTACHMPDVDTKGAGKVVELNSEAIADGLAAIVSDDELRRQFGVSARRLIEERYQWPTIAGQMVGFYERLLQV